MYCEHIPVCLQMIYFSDGANIFSALFRFVSFCFGLWKCGNSYVSISCFWFCSEHCNSLDKQLK